MELSVVYIYIYIYIYSTVIAQPYELKYCMQYI